MPINVTERGVMPPDQTGSQLGQGLATAPTLLIEGGGYQLVDSLNSYVLHFSIPQSIILVRRARVSFALKPAVYAALSGSVSGGNTGGASAGHNHGVPGLSVPGLSVPAVGTPNHQHVVGSTAGTSYPVGATGGLFSDGAGTGFGVIPSSGSGTWHTDSSGAGTTGGGTTGGGTTGGGTSGGQSVDHSHAITGGGVSFGTPTALGRSASIASNAFVYLSTDGGAPVLIKPIPSQPQGPYNALTYADLDFSAYFGKVPATYELTISSATLGGIIAQMQITAELNAS